MNPQRNSPCPCGSGKKSKHCHGKPARIRPSFEEAAWRRLRSALEDLPATMLRFIIGTHGDAAVEEAWAEFTLWEEDAPEFDPGSPELQLFMPWFFYRWSPDPVETRVVDASLHDRPPAGVLLERKGRHMDPLLRRYLEACVVSPFSFHDIVAVEPGRGFRARDVFTGDEREVKEQSASRTMEPGDILYGQLVTSDGLTLMEACATHILPPREKIALVDLRERITSQGPISSEALCDWDMELREFYHAFMEELKNPPTPRLRNTDGETVVLHSLSFEVPSAQAAFNALKHLALDETDEELLESARFDAEGNVQSVSFGWLAKGNPMHREWENTLLGHIEIDGNRMVASVNSAERAARLREMVESHFPDARHTGTEVQTLEEAVARRETDEESLGDMDAEFLAQNPELRESIQAKTAAHYEEWVHREIPALGGITPMEAVGDTGGREKVEAIVRQLEHDGRRKNPPLDEAVTRRLRLRLGLEV